MHRLIKAKHAADLHPMSCTTKKKPLELVQSDHLKGAMRLASTSTSAGGNRYVLQVMTAIDDLQRLGDQDSWCVNLKYKSDASEARQKVLMTCHMGETAGAQSETSSPGYMIYRSRGAP